MLKTITIDSPTKNLLYHNHIYTLNLIVTKIRLELNEKEMAGDSISWIYCSLDLFEILSDSSLFHLSRITEYASLCAPCVGYLFSNRVYLDYQLQGLQFHFNDLSTLRQNKINSILEDGALDKLITYKIKIVNKNEHKQKN